MRREVSPVFDRHRRWLSSCAVRALLAAALTAAGCTQVRRPEQADRAEQVEPIAFLHEHLPTQPMVTVAEAYRAIILLADGDDPFESFDAREQALMDRGIVRPAWNLQRDACIDRGSLAYMICEVLHVRGGVNRETFGALGLGDRRYALRELIYLGLMPDTPSYRYITGGELISAIGKADAYMAENQMYEADEPDVAELLETDVRRDLDRERRLEPRPPGPGPADRP